MEEKEESNGAVSEEERAMPTRGDGATASGCAEGGENLTVGKERLQVNRTQSCSVEGDDDIVSVCMEGPPPGRLPSKILIMSSSFLIPVAENDIERRESDENNGEREIESNQRGCTPGSSIKVAKEPFSYCRDPVWSNLFPERATPQRIKKLARSESTGNACQTTVELNANGVDSNFAAPVHERGPGPKINKKQGINGANPCERVYRRRQRSLKDLSLHDNICSSIPKRGVENFPNALVLNGAKAGDTGLSVDIHRLKSGRKTKLLSSDHNNQQNRSRPKWPSKDVAVLVSGENVYKDAGAVAVPSVHRQSTLEQLWKQPGVTVARAGYTKHAAEDVRPVEVLVGGVSKYKGSSLKSKRKTTGADRCTTEAPAKGNMFHVIPLDHEGSPRKRQKTTKLKRSAKSTCGLPEGQMLDIAEVDKKGNDKFPFSNKAQSRKRSRQTVAPHSPISIHDGVQAAPVLKRIKQSGESGCKEPVMKVAVKHQLPRIRKDGRPDERFKSIQVVSGFNQSPGLSQFGQVSVLGSSLGDRVLVPDESTSDPVERKFAPGVRKDGKPDERFKFKKALSATDAETEPCSPSGSKTYQDNTGTRKVERSAIRPIHKEKITAAYPTIVRTEHTQAQKPSLHSPVIVERATSKQDSFTVGVNRGRRTKFKLLPKDAGVHHLKANSKVAGKGTSHGFVDTDRRLVQVSAERVRKQHVVQPVKNSYKQEVKASAAVGHGKKLPEVQKNGVRKPKRVQLKRLFVDNPEPPQPSSVKKVTSSRVVKSLWSPPKQMKSGPIDLAFSSKPAKTTKFLSLQQLDAQKKNEKPQEKIEKFSLRQAPSPIRENSDHICASDETISDCPAAINDRTPQSSLVMIHDQVQLLHKQKDVMNTSHVSTSMMSSPEQYNVKTSIADQRSRPMQGEKRRRDHGGENSGVRMTPRTRKLTDAMQNFLLQKSTLLQQWKEMELGKIHPSALIGRSCKIFWPLDSEWYPGIIHEYNPQTRKHRIDYEDDEREWVLLGKERVKLYVSAEESKALEMSFGEGSVLGATKKLDADELAVLAAGMEDYSGELSHGDLVWAKVKGYPMWPAFVMDEEHAIISGLEPACRERSIPVQFFGSYDHARISCKKVIQFSKGIMCKYHTKCKRTVFEQGLQEVERYLKVCKLPESMIQLQQDVSDIVKQKRDGAENPDESEEDPEMRTDEKTSLVKKTAETSSTMPLKLGTLQVLSLGKIVRDSEQFHNEHHIWTDGYTAIRKFTSIKDPQKLVDYKMEVSRNPSMRSWPLFRVSPEDGKPVEGPSASACWKSILIKIQRVKEKAGLCEAALLEKKRQSFRSGPSLFGFGIRRVAKLIQALPNARVCSKFTAWIEKPLLEDGAEEPLPAGYRPVEFRWKHLDRCNVCYLDEEYADNQLLQCDKCRIMVHMYCYGEPEAPDGDLWLCNLCRPGAPRSAPFCCLCPVTGGAMKATTDGRWAHITCAMWTPETCLVDVKRMEPVDGISAINKERWKLVCTVCKVPYGACIQCSKPHCRVSFHPLCARAAGLSMEVMEEKAVNTQDDSGLQLLTYCKKHKPTIQGGCIKPESQQNVAGATNKPIDCPPLSSSGCARGEPYNSALRRGHREPEALAAALRKRAFVQNLSYIVTGCMRTPPDRELKGLGGSMWARHWKHSRMSNAASNEAPSNEEEPESEKAVLSTSERFRHMKSTMHQRLTFGKSAIHGWGVFTKRAHCAGDMVIEYAGEIVRPIVADIRERRSYDSLVGAGTYMFRIDDERVVDATHAGSIAHLINHSCEPNCYSRVVAASGEDHIIIFAKRDIPAGVELTYDYRFASKDELLTCYCGCTGCRGSVNTFGSDEEPTKITAPRSELTKWFV